MQNHRIPSVKSNNLKKQTVSKSSKQNSETVKQLLSLDRQKTKEFTAPLGIKGRRESHSHGMHRASFLQPVFTSNEIEKQMREMGLNLDKLDSHRENQLPLEAQDDTSLLVRDPADWLKPESKQGVDAYVLTWNDKGQTEFHLCRVTKQDASVDEQTCKLPTSNNEIKANKLFVCFKGEDQKKQTKRLSIAFKRRKEAFSLISQNQYIDNMPKTGVQTISEDQIERIFYMIRSSDQIDSKTGRKLEEIILELKNEYARSMNKLIFDKYMHQSVSIFQKLTMPKTVIIKHTPYFGKIKIPLFIDDFKEFNNRITEKTLQDNKNSIKAMTKINQLCQQVSQEECIFMTELENVMRLEDFFTHQKTNISNLIAFLTQKWVIDIEETVKDLVASHGDKWQCQDSRPAYEASKLKSFLTVVKYMMQDSLAKIAKRSISTFLDIIHSKMPQKVILHASNQVENWQQRFAHLDPDLVELPLPLFQLEIEEDQAAEQQCYSEDLNLFMESMLQVQKMGINALEDIDQVEKKILRDMFKVTGLMGKILSPRLIDPMNDDPELQTLIKENRGIWEGQEQLRSVMNRALEPLRKYLRIFKKISSEIRLDPNEWFMSFQTGLVHDLESSKAKEEAGERKEDDVDVTLIQDLQQIKAHINGQIEREQELQSFIPDQIQVGIFQISFHRIKHTAIQKHQQIIERLKTLIHSIIIQNVQDIAKAKDKILKTIEYIPTDIRRLAEISRFIEDIPGLVTELNRSIENTQELQELLDVYLQDFSKEDLADRWRLMNQAKEIQDKRDKATLELQAKKTNLIQALSSDKAEFEYKLEQTSEEVNKLSECNDIDKYEEQADKIIEIDKFLEEHLKKATDFNDQEHLFQMPVTNYGIKEISKKFELFRDMWITTRNWKVNHQKWLSSAWFELNGSEIEMDVNSYKNKLAKVKKVFKNKPETEPLVAHIDHFLDEMKDFESFIPLAVNLTSKAIEKRHFEQLSEAVGVKIDPFTEGFTFQSMIDLNILDKLEIIEDTSVRASKEHGIRIDLDNMYNEWRNVDFELMPLKNSDTFIFKNIDTCISNIDESMTITLNLFQSPQKSVFEDEINKWNNEISTVSEVLEKILKLQMVQMQLQPIFTSNDIKKSLAQYQKMFKIVDNRWRNNMVAVQKTMNVFKFCNDEQLNNSIQEDILTLQKVNKNLDSYLTLKRTNFSRMYFLSDEELLKILSNTKEPRNINDQVKKIFENISNLVFDEDTMIFAMESEEGERVPLIDKISPKEYSVEIWMDNVEKTMMESIRFYILESQKEQRKMDRVLWVKKWYCQCVLNGTQIIWTADTEKAINKNQLEEHQNSSNEQIKALVEQVRGQLTYLEKKTISPLIVQGVHERTVIKKLEDLKISTPFEFEWASQLRFQINDDDIQGKCLQTSQPQGYEYLGNTDRLVITPLTDKCYMTLMGAIKLNLGGSPSGPAGTGKTETTKDLAKNLAKLCKVFNCGPEMEQTMIGTFFKGLSSSGAWCCFDEFNRILLEVLSVVAQQMQSLLNEKKKGQKETMIFFIDSEIKVLSAFSVYITMNPDQKGRQELPDNLKALFRPMAMMVPDQALIAEIFLYSFGFYNSTDLARKLVDTFKLCSEQLSAQQHQDQGMRAVKSTISAAGIIKRNIFDADEQQVVLKALIDINLPKFLHNDILLFDNIVKDLFPSTRRPESKLAQLQRSVETSIKEAGLTPVPMFIEKVYQFQDTLEIRHGCMIVGPTGSGKTMNQKVLQSAISRLAPDYSETDENKALNPFRKVITYILNPKSVTTEQVYGSMNPITKEQTKGIVPVIFNKACDQVKTENRQWIMFDGPVDSLWIESMNSVLDDSKKLCLPNSEIIDITKFMKILFETDSLEEASPATISRCGMVQMDNNVLNHECMFDNACQKFDDKLKASNFVSKLKALFKFFVPDLLFQMKKELNPVVLTSDCNQINSLMRLLNAFLIDQRGGEFSHWEKKQMDYCHRGIDRIFMFALCFTLGSNLDFEDREKFTKMLFEKIEVFNISPNTQDCDMPVVKPPEGTSYFNYWVNVRRSEFESWDQMMPDIEIEKKGFEEIIIPTEDSTKQQKINEMLLKNYYPIINCGEPGTGKTINCEKLVNSFPTIRFIPISMIFSARTGITTIQNTIWSRLKRKKFTLMGPENNKKALVFIDDLNMPKKETFGAQPPLELLRHLFEHGGWYEQNEFAFKQIESLYFVCAMGLPGGGKVVLSPRFTRFFNIIQWNKMPKESMHSIFHTISSHFQAKFDKEVMTALSQGVNVVLDSYLDIAKVLLPIPRKSHYMFNLRDVTKVFQGLCEVKATTVNEKRIFISLMNHELDRVFKDRLLEKSDVDQQRGIVESHILEIYGTCDDETQQKDMMFGPFMDQLQDNKSQEQGIIASVDAARTVLEEALTDYNFDNTQMDLILFADAVRHICNICRILKFPSGNCFLMGVGGTGKRSCCYISNFVMNFKFNSIEIQRDQRIDKNWKPDIKNILMIAGAKRSNTCFLIQDSQIIHDVMLEDLNNILNSGHVPGLQEAQDLEEINFTAKKDCQNKSLEQTPFNLYNQYLIAIKRNLHIVLCMSPLGVNFKSQILNFPSLVNCTTIDFQTDWPTEALKSVAFSHLKDWNNDLQDQLPYIVDIFSIIHKSTEEMNEDFFKELKRYNYITPSSQLELIRTFKDVNKTIELDANSKINRLVTGLSIIDKAQVKVEDLQQRITEEEPILMKLEAELTLKNEELTIKLNETNLKREQVRQASEEQNEKVTALEKMNQIIRSEKEETEREKDEALKLAEKLGSKDITEVNSQIVPHEAVCHCMKVIVNLFDEEKKVKDKTDMQEWFIVCKNNLLKNVNELKLRLIERIKKEIITEKQYKKMEPLQDPTRFETKYQENISEPCFKLAGWVRAMRSIYLTNVKLKPIKEKLAEGEQRLAEGQRILDKLNKEKLEAERICKELSDEAEQCQNKKESVANNLDQNKQRLVRATKLLGGFKDERTRWTEEVRQFRENLMYIIGNCLLCSGILAQASPFNTDFRVRLCKIWIERIQEHFTMIDNPSLKNIIGNKVVIENWKAIQKLPDDEFSIENTIIMMNSKRWSLCVDPQLQVNSFIKRMGNVVMKESFVQIKHNDPKISTELEYGIKQGKWILVENVTETIPSELDFLLNPKFKVKGSIKSIIQGDKEIEWSDDFRLYLTSTLQNPKLPPELFVSMNIINFAITVTGLRDQMLSLVISIDKKELEDERNMLIETNARNTRMLIEKEDQILDSLKNSDPEEILDRDDIINQLSATKLESNNIKQSQIIAQEREEQIMIERSKQMDVAINASVLFFCMLDLEHINQMQKQSLKWFKTLFRLATLAAEKSDDQEQRVKQVNLSFKKRLYTEICKTIFDRDRLLFSFNLFMKLQLFNKEVQEQLQVFFLQGNTDLITEELPEGPKQIDNLTWSSMYQELEGLNKFEEFKGFTKQFLNNYHKFEAIYFAEDLEKVKLPGEWQESFNSFEKLIIYKILRPDYLKKSVRNQIRKHQGNHFTESPLLEIEKSIKTSTKDSPILLITSKGSDPLNTIKNQARETLRELKVLSLGQGQDKQALQLFNKCSDEGFWLMQQNINVFTSWMPVLEKLVSEMSDGMNCEADFRLFLTTTPDNSLPSSIIQNSTKLTVEASGDIKQTMLNSYNSVTDAYFQSSKNEQLMREIFFSLTLFHALSIDRKRFGSIGWTSNQDFSSEDLKVSRDQAFSMIDEYDTINFKVLNQMTAGINQGGRVTDRFDTTFIQSFIDLFINESIGQSSLQDYYFDSRKKYMLPHFEDNAGYATFIKENQDNVDAELQGFHRNAEIATNLNESQAMISSLSLIQPQTRSTTGGTPMEVVIEENTRHILAQIPEPWVLEDFERDQPTVQEESMNTVLNQEAVKQNNLFKVCRRELSDMLDVIKGNLVTNDYLDQMYQSLMNNQVPYNWTYSGYGFLSMKMLHTWIKELNERAKFIQGWQTVGTPKTFWMNGFFFPQGFLTGIKQNFARKTQIPIDRVSFEVHFTQYHHHADFQDNQHTIIDQRQDLKVDGCFVHGLYIEGCSIDQNTFKLIESEPKEIYKKLPIIQFRTVGDKEIDSNKFNCPIYKTQARQGTLTTTGHSTNFVISMDIDSDYDKNKWIYAGVAAILGLKDD